MAVLSLEVVHLTTQESQFRQYVDVLQPTREHG
jgi:hypothetical protein